MGNESGADKLKLQLAMLPLDSEQAELAYRSAAMVDNNEAMELSEEFAVFQSQLAVVAPLIQLAMIDSKKLSIIPDRSYSGKRLVDLAVAFTLLTLVAPLLVVIAISVKLSGPGPVLLKQHRLGLGRKPFLIYRFRTMVLDEPALRNAGAYDPRVTRVGSFLRRTTLDELPMLLSIWKGDMTFVGPRPLPEARDEYFESVIPGWRERYTVKPGLTGLAQLHTWHGDAHTGEFMREMARLDLEYVRRQSPITDVVIILRTILRTINLALGRDRRDGGREEGVEDAKIIGFLRKLTVKWKIPTFGEAR